MGLNERKERQRFELREKILGAARELFTEFGYEAVNMREIAKKIEYSPTTIYLYFKDKSALVSELCTADFLNLAKRFNLFQKEHDPIKRLKNIGKEFFNLAITYPNHYRMMFMTVHPPVPVEDRQINKGNPKEDAWAFLGNSVEDAIKAGLFRGDLGDSNTIAQVFFAGVHGVASLYLTKSNDPWINWSKADELFDQMIEALLRSYRK